MSGMDGLRERIAQALWDRSHLGSEPIWAWEYAPPPSRESLLDYADAVITTLQLEELVSYDTPTGDIPPFEFVGDESDLDEALGAYAKAYQIPKVRRWVTPPERVET